jgi:hypothetical protein
MQTFTLMSCLFYNELQAYTLQHKVYNNYSMLPIMQHKPINLTQTYKRKTAKLFLYKYCSKCTHKGSVNSYEQSSPRSTTYDIHQASLKVSGVL